MGAHSHAAVVAARDLLEDSEIAAHARPFARRATGNGTPHALQRNGGEDALTPRMGLATAGSMHGIRKT